MLARDGHERLEGALENSLTTDVLPRSGRHTGIDGEAHRIELAAAFLAAPIAHKVAVGHDDERRRGLTRKDANRLTRLHDEGLIFAHCRKSRDDTIKALPVPRRARNRHIDHKIFGILAVFQVVLQQTQDGFLSPTLAAQDRSTPSLHFLAATYGNIHLTP